MNYKLTTMADRPDLRPQAEKLIQEIWPTFLQQDQVGYEFWPSLYETFPAYQIFLLTADGQTLVAVGNSIPLAWDEADDSLSDEGWRWALAQGFKDLEAHHPTKTLCALSITLNPDFLGQGISSIMINSMKEIGRSQKYGRIIAPVRPNLKNRYPLTPMEQYISWQNDAGLPFDAWMRVHHRLGAHVAKICPKSMRVVGTVSDWENWTNLHMPQSGLYLAHGGLNPIKLNVEKNLGIYFEPNVWMVASL